MDAAHPPAPARPGAGPAARPARPAWPGRRGAARAAARSLRGLGPPAALAAFAAGLALAAQDAQARALLPAALPAWSPWVPAGIALSLLPLTMRRHWIRVRGDALEMRSAAGRERFDLSAVRRIEITRFSGRYDIHVMLKGGGVRRLAARDLADPDAAVAALGARGVPIVPL